MNKRKEFLNSTQCDFLADDAEIFNVEIAYILKEKEKIIHIAQT
jgi:hypothetical protein